MCLTNIKFRNVGILLGLLLPLGEAMAQVPSIAIPAESFGPLCARTGLCFASPAAGVFSLQVFLGTVVIPFLQSVFIGVGVLYVGWYAIAMIMSGGDESTLSEQRRAFEDAVRGMSLVGISVLLVNTFSPSSAGSNLIAPGPFAVAMNRISDYFTIIAGSFLVFMISLAGFRIIALQGEESEVDKQKKNFFNGLMGIAVVLLARMGVQAIIPGAGGPHIFVTEIAGITKFLLEIVAGLAVIAFIVSGMMFIIFLNNDNIKQRARKILLSTIIILTIVIFSLLIVTTFIPSGTP